MELRCESHLEETVGLVEDDILDLGERKLRIKQDVLHDVHKAGIQIYPSGARDQGSEECAATQCRRKDLRIDAQISASGSY
eukprot:scaffold235742_cov28-Tisochrysis_lutea.AAC.1